MRTLGLPLRGLAVAICFIALATHANATDFRDARWGMTLSDVVALHADQLPADRRLGRIAYDGKLANLDVLIYYRFDEAGALVEAGYEVATGDREPLTTISDYKALNSLLRRKYQVSEAPQEIWTNRVFEPKPEEWGRAVRIGHLSYDWSYMLERTTIRHSLNGNRRAIKHVLRYAAREQQSTQDALEQL